MSATPLLTDTELAAFRDVALQGMQTPVTILVRSSVKTDDGWENVYVDAGDTTCWIYSEPTAVQSEVSGKIVTINTYRAYFPIGTVLSASDLVVDGRTGMQYICSDTIAENTWAPMLRASLRFAE